MSAAALLVAATAACGIAATQGSHASAQQLAKGDPVNGRQVYAYWCAACHGRGPGHPGTQSLEVKYRGQLVPPALEDRSDLSLTLTTQFVRHGVALMPPFRKTEISEAQLRDLAAYLTKAR